MDPKTLEIIDKFELPIFGYIVPKRTLEMAKNYLGTQAELVEAGMPNQHRFDKPVIPAMKISLKSFPCPVCNRTFRSKSECERHLRVQTGERPFQCSLCNSRFKQKSHLKVHYRVHGKK
mmetsp:Transcript_14721/g.27943  ORF Transcript_14721/g.27943 Transcript_14721/m.27943 type:complete len:119 (-) Transcript_14721:784-1140(-)